MREKSNSNRALVTSALISILCAACGGDDVADVDGGPVSDSSVADARPTDAGRDATTTSDGGSDASTPDGGADASVPPGCDPPFLLATTTATDFSVSILAELEIATSAVDVAATALSDSDSTVVASGCRAFVINRAQGVVNVQTRGTPLTTAHSFDVDPTGATGMYVSNPVTVVSITDTKAYVVNLGRNALTLVDPTQDGEDAILGEIDLTPYLKSGDMDGHVDASDAILVDGRVYVALGNYWFDSGFAQHFEGSELAIIDASTDALVDADAVAVGTQGIGLDNENPWRGLAWVEEDAHLWVGATGSSFALDGAIEVVDPAAMSTVSTIVDETALDAEIMAYARIAADRVLVLAGTEVVAVNPSGLSTSVADGVDGMLVHDGTLYVWSRNAMPGLRTFDATTGTETTPSAGPHTFGTHPLSTLVPAP